MVRDTPAPTGPPAAESAWVEANATVSRIASLGGPLLVVAGVSSVPAPFAGEPSWWKVCAGAMVLAAVAWAPAAWWASPGWSRAARWAVLVLSPLATLANLAGQTGGQWEVPWPWTLEPLAVAAAVTLLPLGWAYTYSFASVLSVPLLVILTDMHPDADWWGPVSLHVANVVFVTLIDAMRSQLARQTLSLHNSRVAREARGRAVAWQRERSRVDAVIHDEVLATLLAGATGTPGIAEPLAAQAASTSAMLDSWGSAEDAEGQVGWEGPLLPWVCDLAADAGTELLLDGRPRGAGEPLPTAFWSDVPADAALALEGSVRQALRNCRLHAPGARTTVDVDTRGPGVAVSVRDDGPGFRPEEVSASRLGIRLGIVERMHAVEGGGADIVSRPGAGTRVHLWWTPPAGTHAADADTPRAHPRGRGRTPDLWRTEPSGRGRAGRTGSWQPGAAAADGNAADDAVHASGMTSRAMRGALMVGWVVGACASLPLSWHVSPPGAVATAVWLGVASHAVTHPDTRLGPARTLVVATAPTVVAVSLLLLLDRTPTSQVWAWQFAGNLVGLLAARGRVAPALAGTVAQGVLLVAWLAALPAASRPGTGVSLLVMGLVPFLVGVAWCHFVRQSVLAARAADRQTERARLGADAAVVASERGVQLMSTVAALARPVLDRLTARETGGDVELGCRIAESAVRDLIRAPRLAVAPLDAACEAARRRGVLVALMDDGDEAAALPPGSLDELGELVRGAVARGDTRVQVRALPPGRDVALTFLSDGAPGGGQVRRQWPAPSPVVTGGRPQRTRRTLGRATGRRTPSGRA